MHLITRKLMATCQPTLTRYQNWIRVVYFKFLGNTDPIIQECVLRYLVGGISGKEFALGFPGIWLIQIWLNIAKVSHSHEQCHAHTHIYINIYIHTHLHIFTCAHAYNVMHTYIQFVLTHKLAVLPSIQPWACTPSIGACARSTVIGTRGLRTC